MKTIAEEFYRKLSSLTRDIAVADDRGATCALTEGIEKAGRLLYERSQAGGIAYFIGNGANASIGGHMSLDFWKNCGIRAVSFSDPACLTAVGNDLGFENLFSKPLEMFARSGDVLIAMSSSGASPNILKAVTTARGIGCRIITLSGFKPANPLRTMGHINFYVPHESYALVEVAHHSICHCILEAIMRTRKNG